MADESKQKKPGWFQRMVSAPRRLSTAAYVSWLTALLLIVIVAVVWIAFFTGKSNVHDALSWTRMLTAVALVIVIPIVLYRGLRLWLEGDPSRFPEIDFAWNAGLEALRKSGLALENSPIVLVLGSSNERGERSLMRASGRDFRVRGIPEGAAPLHWYAAPDGIFLFCTDASWLSALSVLAEKKPVDSAGVPAGAFMAASQPRETRRSVPAPAAPAPLPPPAPKPSEGIQGTVMLDQFLGQSQAPAAAPPPPAAAAESSRTANDPDFGTTPSARGNVSYSTDVEGGDTREELLAIVPPLEATNQLQRLQYVCHLLRRSRQPYCSLNGILTLLPFPIVQASPAEVEELQRAIKSDLLTVQRGVQVRCPVTALVVGLDREQGFSELVRRVGPERAASQRFGRKYDVRCLAEREGLTAFCDHVCGAFEDWVHSLFREQETLTRPGNTRLYGLLCKVRCNLKTRLTGIISGAFGYDARELPNDDPFLFSGCYFAATGETSDRQAFVKGVVDKLTQEQEYVEWSQQARAADRHYRRLAIGGFLSSTVLLLCLAAMLIDLIL